MKFAIIHISDIHYMKEHPESASHIISVFLKDLKVQCESLKEYEKYIAITGDVVYEGNDNESYINLFKEIDGRLNEIGLTKECRMIVPGNHDIDRSVIERDFKKYKNKIYKSIKNEQAFNSFIKDKDSRPERFGNYQLFETDFAKHGIGCNVQGKGWKVNKDLSVYCLNTALSSFAGFKSIKDEKRLAVGTGELIDWCRNNEATINLLLMHHPLSSLISWSKSELKQTIDKKFLLCLCGHDHEQDVFYNQISQKSLICSAPQLFTSKEDLLGYAIILIEDSAVKKIMYREYVNGTFLKGSRISKTDDGIVNIKSKYHDNKDKLERKLDNALALFKNQPVTFVEPKISKSREFNDNENILKELIQNPHSSFIIAQPQFGLTCLSRYMQLEAYTKNDYWIYIDAEFTKVRKILNDIDDQLQEFSVSRSNLKCIILDSWDDSKIEHISILMRIDEAFKDVPIIVMSNYIEHNFSSDFEFSKLSKEYKIYHLQAYQRNKVREFVSKHYQEYGFLNEDELVEKVVKNLEVLNVHRTPLNCLTLLKAFENGMSETLVNRTKMIKTVLFILFTDAESLKYTSNKPDVGDCEYVLGKFCKILIEERTIFFAKARMISELKQYCKEMLVGVKVDTIVDVLELNNILIHHNDRYQFKHRYWIFYFAASYMLKDDKFKNYIFSNRNYVNYPEIVEFYTGIDGMRVHAIETLLKDMNKLINTVENKIGIIGEFNPFEGVVWGPSKETIESIKKDVSEKVQHSKLPTKIKDHHADKFYNSEAPYDQSISKFLNEYSVISLMQGIKASSRALRNSDYVDPKIKIKMLKSLLNGWMQMSKVIFWLAPTLAKQGEVTYGGLNLILTDSFNKSPDKIKSIFIANPYNVVNFFKDDISSKKIGPLLFNSLKSSVSDYQKHFICLFLIKEKPDGWYDELFEYMNLLHPNSFYLGDISHMLSCEIISGFVSEDEMRKLKNLSAIIVAKHKYAPKLSKNKVKYFPKNKTISEENKLEVDKIISGKKLNNVWVK